MTTPAAREAPPIENEPRRRWPRPDRAEAAGAFALLLILGLMAVLVLQSIAGHPKLSYLDEIANGDYLYRASHGGMVRPGELLGPEIMSEQACRGVAGWPDNPPTVTCPDTTDPALLPGWDVNSADIHPPTYYWATAGMAKVIQRLTSVDSLLTAGRMANVVWFGAALVLLYLVLRDLRVPVLARLAACLLLAVQPAMIQHMSMVNVSVTTVLAGALLVLALVRWEQRRWNVALLGLAAALCLALKADTLVPVFAVCLYLLVRTAVLLRPGDPVAVPGRPGVLARRGRDGDWRRYLVAAVVTGAAAVSAELVWLAVRSAITSGEALPNPAARIFLRDHVTPDDFVSQLTALILPLGPVNDSQPIMVVAGILLLAGPLAAMLYRRPADPLHSWGIAAVAGVTLGGPLLMFGTYLSTSAVVPTPSRYGFSMVPAMLVLLAVVLGRRAAPLALIAVTLTLLAIGPVAPPTRTDLPPPRTSSAPAPANAAAPGS